MRLLDDVQLPVGLAPDWRRALAEELEVAEEALPSLSPAALELAELAVSGEYDATIVGAVLERDANLRDQVLRLANSAMYVGERRIEDTATAAQRIGMRALWEIAVIDVARIKVFGPVLGQVLGGSQMWSIARLAGTISLRLSAARLGKNRASILAGLILCVGPPLSHQLIRRVEERVGARLPSRLRREVSNRLAPSLGVSLVRAWSLSESIVHAATTFADGRGELPADTESQIAVFSVSLSRFVTARGRESLELPLEWPTARALSVTEDEIRAIVFSATEPGASPLAL